MFFHTFLLFSLRNSFNVDFFIYSTFILSSFQSSRPPLFFLFAIQGYIFHYKVYSFANIYWFIQHYFFLLLDSTVLKFFPSQETKLTRNQNPITEAFQMTTSSKKQKKLKNEVQLPSIHCCTWMVNHCKSVVALYKEPTKPKSKHVNPLTGFMHLFAIKCDLVLICATPKWQPSHFLIEAWRELSVVAVLRMTTRCWFQLIFILIMNQIINRVVFFTWYGPKNAVPVQLSWM